MEKIRVFRSLIEYLKNGHSEDKNVNNSMRLIETDIQNSLETLRICPNYESEEEVYEAIKEGVVTYLSDGINYQSFVNTLALVKKHLILLRENGAESYDMRITFELA